jgi:uncharacterized repeat protein (TIGR01451 family)
MRGADDRGVLRARAYMPPVLAVLALLLLVAVAGFAIPARAVTSSPLPGSNFQAGDGNQTAEAPYDDWQSAYGLGQVATQSDANAADTSFGGGKEESPDDWTYTTAAGGVTPSKDNILNAFYSTQLNSQGNFVYFGFQRESNNGNSFLGIVVQQRTDFWVNRMGTTITCRTAGDVLISYEAGSNAIQLYKWVPATTDPASGCSRTGTFSPMTVTATNAQGAINPAAITNYMGLGGASFGTGLFGEGAANLSETGGFTCERYRSMFIHTRTSASISSSLEDTTEPTAIDLGGCEIDVQQSAPVTARHFDSVTFNYTVTNPGAEPQSSVTLTDNRCPAANMTGPVKTGGNQDAILVRGETWTYSCTYTIGAHASGESDPIASTATVSGTFGSNVTTDTSTHSIDLLHPQVAVDQEVRRGVSGSFTQGPLGAHAGDDAYYRFTLTNPGDTALTVSTAFPACDAATLSATMGDTDFDGQLDPGESWVSTCRHTLTASDPDPLSRVAQVTGTDSLGDSVSASDTTVVDLLHAGIAAQAALRRGTSGPYVAGPVPADVGDTLSFRFTVANTGDAEVQLARTTTRCDTGTLSAPSGDTDSDGRLDTGETWTYTCTHVVTAADPDPVVNTFDVTATDAADGTATATASASGDVLHPAIALLKEVRRGTTGAYARIPAEVHVGDTLSYRLTVTNPGDTPLTVTVSDPRCDAGTLSSPTGDADGDGLLDESETFVLTCTHAVTASDPDPLPNTATATGTSALGATRTASDSAYGDVLHPGAEVDVEGRRGTTGAWSQGPIEAHVGDTLSFRFTITNTADATLDLSISAARCAAGTLSAPSGDTDGDGRLDPAETWVYTCTSVLASADPDPYLASVTASGTDNISGRTTSLDGVTVDILHPQVSLDAGVRRGPVGAYAAGPIDARVGDQLFYRYVVANTGDAAASVALDTPACDSGTRSAPSGDLDADGSLDPGERWTFTCTHVVTAADPDPLTQTSSVTVTDDLGGSAAVSATTRADILHASAALDQEIRRGTTGAWSQTPVDAHVGTTLGLRFTLTNTGDAPLTPSLGAPACDAGTLGAPAGDADGDGLLDVGETWVYTCTHEVTAGDGDPFSSAATVTATDALGTIATATDSVTADVLHPGIAVAMSERRGASGAFVAGPIDTRVGDTLGYAMTVTNSGDTPLTVDLSTTRCDTGTLSAPAGDANADGRLDVAETWTYTCTHDVTSADSDPLVTQADVTGTDTLGATATASGAAVADVLHARVAIDTASRLGSDPFTTATTNAHEGDTVQLRTTVTNAGDTSLDVNFTGTGCDAGTLSGPDGDADGDGRLDVGETWTYTCTHLVGATDADPMALGAEVTVTDAVGGSASAASAVTVNVLHPGIAIDQEIRRGTSGAYGQGPIDTHVGDIAELRFTLTNTGDTALAIDLSAPACDAGTLSSPTGDVDGDDRLDVDEAWTYTCAHTVSATDDDPFTSTATATGSDTLGGTATASDSAGADVLHPGVAVEATVRRGSAGAFTPGPVDVLVGQTLEHRYTLTNTGDTPLNVTLSAPGCDAGTLSAPAGDIDGDGRLGRLETWQYDCTHAVAASDDDPLTSAVSVTAADVLGGTDNATDSTRADVLHAGVSVDTASRVGSDPFTGAAVDAHIGDTIDLRITLVNTGDTAVDVALVAPRCDSGSLSAPQGDTDGNGRLDVGETWTYTCTHTVTAADPDPLVLRADVTATDAAGGTASAGAAATIDVLHPGVAIDQEIRRGTTGAYGQGPIDAHIGDTVSLRFTLTNTGDTATTPSLDTPGCDAGTLSGPAGDADGDSLLDVGETWTYTCTHELTAGDGDPFTTTASVTASDTLGGTATADSSASVDVLHPGIALALAERRGTSGAYVAGPIDARVGDTLGYEMTLTNSGDTPLTVDLTPTRCDTGTLSTPTGDADGDDQLDVTETWTYTCTHDVTSADSDPLVTEADVTGTDTLGATATATAAAVADVLHPGVMVDTAARVGDEPFTGSAIKAHDGDSIYLRITIVNTGDTAVDVALVAPRCDSGSLSAPQGDTDANGRLDVGETWTYTCTHVVTPADPDPLVLRADVTGTDAVGGTASADSAVDVNVLHPGVTIDQEIRRGTTGAYEQGPVDVHTGDTAGLRFTLTNTGDTELSTALSTPQCDAGTRSSATGDLDADGLLDVDETWVYTCDHEITTGDGDPFTSTASVTATDTLGGTSTETDDARADVLHPGIAVEATVRRIGSGGFTRGPVDVLQGQTLEHRFVVTNTGDTPLDVDLAAPSCDAGTLATPKGDTDGDGLLDETETWRFYCTHVVTATDDDPLTSTVIATGTDTLEGTDVSTSATSADVLHAGITADVQGRRTTTGAWSDGPFDARTGDTLRFRITATNTGDTPVDVALDDPRCDPASLSGPTGDDDGDRRLDTSETWTWTCSHVLTASDPDPFVNRVELTATDDLRGTATASDSMRIDVLGAGIDLDVTQRVGSSGAFSGTQIDAHEGDRLELRHTVSNTGETSLDVDLSAPGCDVATITGPTGDTDGDGRLDTTETWTFTCTHVVTTADGDPFVSDASVTGSDVLGGTASATDSAPVDVLHPSLTLDEQARRGNSGAWAQGPVDVRAGDELQLRLTATNDGDTPLAVTAGDPRCDAGTLDGPAGDADGDGRLDTTETWIWTCSHAVGSGDRDPLSGTATATGTDVLGGTDTATDGASADILNPGITLDAQARRGNAGAWSTGQVDVRVGDTLSRRYLVTNDGDTPVAVTLADPGCDAGTLSAPAGDADGDGLLDETETWTFTCTHQVTSDDPDPLTSTARATGTDVLGGTSSATDDTRADVLAPGIAISAQVPALAHQGDDLPYRFTVRNSGRSALTPSLSGTNCAAGTLSRPSGDSDGDGLLDRDETWTYSCVHRVTADDGDPATGTVRVDAIDTLGAPAGDQADMSTDVLHPALAVHQDIRTEDGAWTTSQVETQVGARLQLRFTATNPGDAPLDVQTVDSRCDAGSASAHTGDDDGDRRLDSDETWVWTCVHTTTVDDPENFRSPVTLTGTDALSRKVEAGDTVGARVHPVANLTLTKTGPSSVSAGADIAYSLVVVNHGPSAARGVVVRDPLPAGLTLRSATPSQGSCSAADGVVTCALGTMADGSSAQISLVTTATGDIGGTDAVNTASVSSEAGDPDGGDNKSTATVSVQRKPIPASADLVVDKTLADAADTVGSTLTYVVTVANDGPGTATGVVANDTLTNAVRLVGVTPSQGTCAGAPAIACKLGTIAPGRRATIRIRVTALRDGPLTNVATASAATNDPNLANNRASASRTIKPRQTLLHITKRASRPVVRAGQNVSFRIVVRAARTAGARRVRVCDRLPRQLSFVSAPGAVFRDGSACWTIKTLRAGRAAVFTVRAHVARTASTRRVSGTAAATAANAPAAKAAAGFRVQRSAPVRAGGVTG